MNIFEGFDEHLILIRNMKEKRSVDKYIDRLLKEYKDSILDTDVNELELTVRTSNCLKNSSIYTIRELTSKSEADLTTLRNWGIKSIGEVKDKLKQLGLRLNMSKKDHAAWICPYSNHTPKKRVPFDLSLKEDRDALRGRWVKFKEPLPEGKRQIETQITSFYIMRDGRWSIYVNTPPGVSLCNAPGEDFVFADGPDAGQPLEKEVEVEG